MRPPQRYSSDALTNPTKRSRATAKVAAVEIVAATAVVVVVAREGISGIGVKAEAITAGRTGAMVAEPELTVIAVSMGMAVVMIVTVVVVTPMIRLRRGCQGGEPQDDARDAYKLEHLQPLDCCLPFSRASRMQTQPRTLSLANAG
jgi:hypothetical protein